MEGSVWCVKIGKSYLGLSVTLLWDFNVEILDDFTCLGVLDSFKELFIVQKNSWNKDYLSDDSEGIRDDSTGITRVDTFFDNLNLHVNS